MIRGYLRRWGALWILVVLFFGSWVGQAVAMYSDIAEQGWHEFWSATLENWQSEFLQLAFQAVLMAAYSGKVFRKGDEDQERLEAKIDRVLIEMGKHHG